MRTLKEITAKFSLSLLMRVLVEAIEKIRVLIVDDCLAWRTTLRMCLSALPGLEIVGAVPDGRSALEDFETCQPNLVLLDINMPGMDGFETAQALLAAHPGLWIIGVSADVQPNFQQRAQQAGLKTIIAKDMLLDYLPPMDLKPLAV